MNPLRSGVYFLSQILQNILNQNVQATVMDINRNVYLVGALLTTLANPTLLNAIFYWDQDSGKITYCQTTPGLPQPYPENGWVNAIGGLNGGPGYAVPPPGPGTSPGSGPGPSVQPHLYIRYT
jgi:hypothetical protein